MTKHDRRSARDPRDRAPRPEIGTETVSVDLVELQSVAKGRRGGGTVAILVLSLVGVLVFAAIVLTGRPLEPSPSPSAPAIAVASASPGASDLATAAPTLSSRPSLAVPTLRPTEAPVWAWTRGELPIDSGASIYDLWGVGDRILALANADDRWIFPSLVPGRAWRAIAAPPVIDAYMGGSVIDDRLWFVARVTGITAEDSTWQLVSTADGETWDSLGPTEGVGLVDYVPFVGRLGSTWVMAPVQYLEDLGGMQQSLRWSDDGVRWHAATLPELSEDTTFVNGAATADLMVILTLGNPDEEPTPGILRSTDGKTWRRGSLPESLDLPYDVACNERACVMTGFELESPEIPVAWVSTDGRTWTKSTTTLPNDAGHGGLRTVVPTDTGFLGLAGEPFAWLSVDDGQTWRMFDVVPVDETVRLVAVAVAGDVVIALEEQVNNSTHGVWRGSLTRMTGPTR